MKSRSVNQSEYNKARYRLNSIKIHRAQIEAKAAQIEQLETLKLSAHTTNLTGCKVQTSRNINALEDTIIRINGVIQRLKEGIEHHKDLISLIGNEIQRIENPLYMRLLIKRYIEGKSLEVIANETNYTVSHIKTSHRRAIEAYSIENVTRWKSSGQQPL